MGLLQLYNVIDAKSLLISDANRAGDYFISYLAAAGGKVLDIEYYALRRTGDIRAPYSRLAPGTYTVSMGIFRTSDSQRLTYQTDAGFTADAGQGRKLGSLSLTTAEIDAAFTAPGAGSAVDAYFAIDVDMGKGGHESYRENIKLLPALITAATTVPAGSETLATQSWVRGLFVAINSAQGAHRIVRDDDGIPYEVYMGTNGQWQIRKLNAALVPPATP